MKEIKFRAQGDIDGIWVYGNLFKNECCMRIISNTTIIQNDDKILGEITLVDPETVGQFTGLTDNNGTESKEVYGGDILYNSDRDEYQEVIYNESEARWDVRYPHGEQGSLYNAIGNLNIVAGNIHQDKELLESWNSTK